MSRKSSRRIKSVKQSKAKQSKVKKSKARRIKVRKSVSKRKSKKKSKTSKVMKGGLYTKSGLYTNSGLCNKTKNLNAFCSHIEVIYENYFKKGFNVTKAYEKRETFKNHVIDVLLKTKIYIGYMRVNLNLNQKDKMIAVSILLDYCSKHVSHFNTNLNIGRNDSNDVTLDNYISEIKTKLETQYQQNLNFPSHFPNP